MSGGPWNCTDFECMNLLKCLILILLVNSQAWANPNSACRDYQNILSLVRQELKTHFRDLIINPDHKIDCLPVLELDRAARSLKGQTVLNWPLWKSYWNLQKIRLALHESFVLDGFELDGQYGLTAGILPELLRQSRTLFNLLGAPRYQSSGSFVHFFAPFEVVDGGRQNFEFVSQSSDQGSKSVLEKANEYCLRLGFARVARIESKLPSITCQLNANAKMEGPL